jgi:hypothetical protein
MESDFSTQQGNIGAQYREVKAWARENFTHDQLLHMFAKTWIEANLFRALAEAQKNFDNELEPLQKERERLELEQEKQVTLNYAKIAVEALNKGLRVGGELIAHDMKTRAKELGKKAAEIRHGKPGGSREKANEMRLLWASGKYLSRDICAEQESGALGLSFSTARKALRNTPDPI